MYLVTVFLVGSLCSRFRGVFRVKMLPFLHTCAFYVQFPLKEVLLEENTA